MLYIGSHVGFNKNDQLLGSLNEALKYGANTFMFYTGAPQNTARSTIDSNTTLDAISKMEANGIDINKIIVHAPYIINLCNSEKFDFSVDFLTEEIRRVNSLGVKYLVLHPGSHVGIGIDAGIKMIAEGINTALKNVSDNKVIILLETMAGKGSEVGSKFSEIKEIIDLVSDKEHIGVCLDTCHLNDSGYDISDFNKILDEFDKIVGIDKIGCIHINDSKNEMSAHKDRHENIGFGTIGFDTLINIIYNERLEHIPKILETPYVDKEYPPYKYEIEMIRNKEFNNNLLEDIRKQG